MMNVHVYSEPGMASVNSYVIEGADGVVVIDAQRSTSSAKKLLDAIREVDRPVVAIFLTHPHPDHFGGLPVLTKAYPQAPLYALAQTRDGISSGANGYIEQSIQALGEDFDKDIPLPTRIAQAGEELTVAGIRFQIEDAGLGEADCMMMLYAPAEDALFCADVVQHDMTAFLLEGHSEAWLRQVEAVADRYASVPTVYPGHGAAGPGSVLFGSQKRYLEEFRRLVEQNRVGDGSVSDAGKQNIVAGMNRLYPGYQPVAAIPDLLERDVEAVRKEMQSAV